MAELATIARPYAEALFKASSSDVAGTSAWLEKIAAIAANPCEAMCRIRFTAVILHGER